MTDKLYELMDWPAIEGIVYSEEDRPDKLLGAHVVKSGILVQCFMPGAVSVTLVKKKPVKRYEMELADEAGFFAVLVPGKRVFEYEFEVTMEDGRTFVREDTYAYGTTIAEEDIKAFNAGVNYEVYNMLGAHRCEVRSVSGNTTFGTRFAVWAPNALRVSIVGDFNDWDGRVYQMVRRNGGVFELFIPEDLSGQCYKYEIKNKAGIAFLKADPYAFDSELRPDTASMVCDLDGFLWKDEKWLSKRADKSFENEPMSVYELHLGTFMKPKDGREFYTYTELAPMVIDYVKKMNYTHVELMPITEHPYDGSWGYQVTGYYAPTKRYGTPKDFMNFVDELHRAGIGVIMDWVPAHFPKDAFGLAWFDGSCLYEYSDPRIGEHKEWGTLVFDYGRNEVKNFLIGSALFFIDKYHIDGIRMDAVASMLYRDYSRRPGEWIANIYGGNEHLEACEFLKHINSIIKKRVPDVCLIAEESTAYPMITGNVKEGGLGFDMKWNMGFMNDFISFMSLDPLYRKYHYGELLFSMIYAYSEKFMLAFSHDEVVHGKASMIGKMPGDTHGLKFANLRVLYGYMFMHPGKKMLFMGQDFGQFDEWNESEELQWGLLKYDEHAKMQKYVADLNKFYTDNAPLYELDYTTDGFEWINNISANEVITVFLRKDSKGNNLLVVANFTPVARANYKIGVPFAGKYKEIFNSDSEAYGGNGYINRRVKTSKKDECDGREDSIRITVPPLGISVFRCTEE